jgi:hypothetical protein
MVDGKPFMPRVIQWRDEPLGFLSQRGFNTLQLSSQPSAELVAEARRHRLWFICTAPRPDDIGNDPVGHADDRVLAWILDDPAIEVDPGYGRNWAALIRQHDAVRGRPIVVSPNGDPDTAANMADIMLATHPRIGQMPPPDIDEWLAGQWTIAQPGVPLWLAVAGQLSEKVGEQANALGETLVAPPEIDSAQLETIVQLSFVRGFRGLIVRTASPLDENTRQAQRRAASLELLNRRLELIEPWIASGNAVGKIESADAKWTGIVLLADRSRLLVPIQANALAGDAQLVQAKQATRREAVFIVPGIPEACHVYWLSPAGLRPLATRRVAGGTRIVLPDPHVGMTLITEDAKVVETFRQHVARNSQAAARLARNMAEQQRHRLAEVGREIARLRYGPDPGAATIPWADAQLRQCDAQLSAGRMDTAYELALEVCRILHHAGNEQWRLVSPKSPLISNPLALSSDQVLEYAAFLQSSRMLRGGENLLHGGDFEDLGQMTQFGWQHLTHSSPGIESRATLSANHPQHAAYCLELSAESLSNSSSLAMTNAPVWITSHPVPVEQGQTIAITGWIRIDEPIKGGVAGLEVVDSLGGPELALSVRQTAGWQVFEMFRAVPESTELRVTFALAGLGTAFIDGVMVRVLEEPAIRRLPPVMPPESLIGPNTADNSGSLLTAPGTR